MNPLVLFFLSSLFINSMSSKVEPSKNTSAHITVMGLVYCDICSNNSFSRHSYFLPGSEVRIDCKFKASWPKTREQISFSVNRTTNRYGMYKLEIPSVDGIACAQAAIDSSCEASLMSSSSKACNIPGYKSTTNEIAIKIKQQNLCIYSLNALNFRPSKTDAGLCGNRKP
ncbi:hypothetical protein SADUNF_Sadunf16G0204400 [Salix dunnii]|uniref:Pollen Ole e 1 allergen and extensin family protein n=1 Tax=Salix dunnii TaxID=1413687 RepID=A0A835J7T7_9ROSI|nr:hypothetical protein SADUNF_Sadunf16G0204400 [Salix dunnii]